MSASDSGQISTGIGLSEGLQGILENVFASTSNGMLIVAAGSNRIIAVNPAFSRITGYAADEVIGRNPSILNSGRQDPGFYDTMWRELLATGRWEGEIWNRRKNGELYAEWLAISTVRDDRGSAEYFVGIFSDISTIKDNQDDLVNLAYYDPLTGLPNRLLFQDRLHQTLEHARRDGQNFALCFIDLDGFKPINDNYGHLAGDEVLEQVASRLKGCVRAVDTVARLGGDEFVILADQVGGVSDLTCVVRKVMKAMKAEFVIHGGHVSCGASIGVAVYPESGRDAETLLRNADSAMYEVKKNGKGGVHFHALPPLYLRRSAASMSGKGPHRATGS